MWNFRGVAIFFVAWMLVRIGFDGVDGTFLFQLRFLAFLTCVELFFGLGGPALGWAEDRSEFFGSLDLRVVTFTWYCNDNNNNNKEWLKWYQSENDDFSLTKTCPNRSTSWCETWIFSTQYPCNHVLVILIKCIESTSWKAWNIRLLNNYLEICFFYRHLIQVVAETFYSTQGWCSLHVLSWKSKESTTPMPPSQEIRRPWYYTDYEVPFFRPAMMRTGYFLGVGGGVALGGLSQLVRG